MSEEKKKEGFIQVTWKEIVAATLSLLIVGAVGFVFSSYNGRLTSVEDTALVNKDGVERIDILMDAELREAIRGLTKELEENTDDITSFSNTQRSLERAVTRLEAIIERIE